MDNNHADALLNMELEARLQERVREIVMNDKNIAIAIGRVLALEPAFLNACKANYEHLRMTGRI
jgi:hypothetical protein